MEDGSIRDGSVRTRTAPTELASCASGYFGDAGAPMADVKQNAQSAEEPLSSNGMLIEG